jgi:hypothetical protein
MCSGCISNCRKFGACILANEVKQSGYAMFLYWIASGFALAKTSKVFSIDCDNLKRTLYSEIKIYEAFMYRLNDADYGMYVLIFSHLG